MNSFSPKTDPPKPQPVLREIKVTENRAAPSTGGWIVAECSLCGKLTFVRREHMRAALDEHRRIGCSAETEVYRSYKTFVPNVKD